MTNIESTDFNRYEYFGGGTHLQHSLADINLKQDQIYYTNWRYVYAS